MLNGDERVRVYNNYTYDWYVTTITGQVLSIKPGAFVIMTVNDILSCDAACSNPKPFSQKGFSVRTLQDKPVSLEELGLVEAAVVKLSTEEIQSVLKGSAKKIEAWLSEITDIGELEQIYSISKDMDLSLAKVKVLRAKMPEKDWLDEMKEEA